MTISIAIGSDVNDIRNIQDTIKILKYTQNIIRDGNLSLPDDNIYKNYTSEDLDKITDWYNGIYNILTNPTFFSSLEEEVS